MQQEKPRWVESGQYRNIPLPIKPIPPPVKHLDFVKYMGLKRNPLYPESKPEKASKSLTRKKRRWA
jgi:hypothetical protein